MPNRQVQSRPKGVPCRPSGGWRILLPPFGALLLAVLACGGFEVRVTPTVAPPPTEVPATALTEEPPTAEPTLEATALSAPTPIPIVTPTTSTQASPQPKVLAPGTIARVMAGGGLNMRDRAGSQGKQIGRLNQNALVTVVAGPTKADNYDWWQVDDRAGMVGWVAAGPANDPWLIPDARSGPAKGSGKLVNRPIRLGDRVQVTTAPNQFLSIRETAGKGATLVARAMPGDQFTVRGGPVQQDDLVWWQLEGANVSGWGTEGKDPDRWLVPVE